MPSYSFEAIDRLNNVTRGIVTAGSREEAVGSLAGRGLTVADLREDSGETIFGTLFNRKAGKRSGSRSLEKLLDDWARLMRIGLNIDQALTISIASYGSSTLGSLANEVRTNIREGQSLARAVAATFPDSSTALVSCIEAGERSGQLAEMLASLADRIRAARRFTSELRSALAYPTFVLAMAGALIGVLVYVVLPSLGDVLTDSAARLPWTTLAILDGAACIRRYGLTGAAILAAVAGFLPFLIRLEKIRNFAEAGLLKTPVAGRIVSSIEISSFVFNLAVQIRGGVGIARAVTLCESALRLQILRRRAGEMQRKISQGMRVSQAAGACFSMAAELPALIRIGEENGRLADVLAHAGEHYEEKARRELRLVSALITPAVTVLTGIVVGAVVLSMMSALVGLNDLAFR